MARRFSGRRLRDERIAAGLSYEHVAIAARRSAHSIREYEWDRVTPPVPILATLADFFGRPVDAFFVEVDDDAA